MTETTEQRIDPKDLKPGDRFRRVSQFDGLKETVEATVSSNEPENARIFYGPGNNVQNPDQDTEWFLLDRPARAQPDEPTELLATVNVRVSKCGTREFVRQSTDDGISRPWSEVIWCGGEKTIDIQNALNWEEICARGPVTVEPRRFSEAEFNAAVSLAEKRQTRIEELEAALAQAEEKAAAEYDRGWAARAKYDDRLRQQVERQRDLASDERDSLRDQVKELQTQLAGRLTEDEWRARQKPDWETMRIGMTITELEADRDRWRLEAEALSESKAHAVHQMRKWKRRALKARKQRGEQAARAVAAETELEIIRAEGLPRLLTPDDPVMPRGSVCIQQKLNNPNAPSAWEWFDCEDDTPAAWVSSGLDVHESNADLINAVGDVLLVHVGGEK